ncbi:MAG: hypothetical protein H6Q58_638 [Firmicutes bacterium]|nr:hypothetical protein [Bacillota bacterium]
MFSIFNFIHYLLINICAVAIIYLFEKYFARWIIYGNVDKRSTD